MYDIAIAGGGINGCGVARDAAGRGYSVLLAEMSDLASGTSSRSTKLVHGGLRYLEHYEFRLVRESLMEREVLWGIAPHIIRPLRFVLPHHKGLRPAWLLRLGLFLYDHIGGRRRLAPTRTLDLSRDEAGRPLKPGYAKGFEYSDLWVDDARLVVLNARDAADKGADIRPRTRIVEAHRAGDHWDIALQDAAGNIRHERARLLVNAAGPWVDEFLTEPLGRNDTHHVRLVQGSHIVVPALFGHGRCYIFQNSDGRIIFAIPYENGFTLIGTTDRDFEGDPATTRITPDEIAYLCRSASEYFRRGIAPDDVVWSFSGVRPLFDDGASKAQEATRDYVLRSEGGGADAPLINVFGGKITTYRRLSEEILDLIGEAIGARGASWTATAPLPGGDFAIEERPGLTDAIAMRHPAIPRALADRLATAYGTRAFELLDGVETMEDMGQDFGAGLTAREVRYLMRGEWAATAEDVLWRRSKLGLHIDAGGAARLEAFMAAQTAGVEAAG
ncbi:MAG: glycerol-3-phosphate dehydrogenase [Flavobacteriaceae bacterium]